MLSQILQALSSATLPLCAESLARMLDKDTVVVAAMLEELTVMGRIQTDRQEGACEACQARSLCGLSVPSNPTYMLIPEMDTPRQTTTE